MLPVEVTSFVGRMNELAQVRACFREGARLVTLTGVGGVGKSRLALRAARVMAPALGEGVRYVDLTPLRHDELVVQAVADSVGSVPVPGDDPTESLIRDVLDEDILLVLDNCDHLQLACSKLASVLLTRTRGVIVLATSRAPLDASGEWLVPVAPLIAPDGRTGEKEAVQLFVDRVRAVRPGFVAEADNVEQIATLCRRLDGLPLAIELAARRMRVLSLAQLTVRLEDRFRVLTEAPRDAPERHRSLLAVLDLSFDQCGVAEQALWARASVFVAGATFEALESVCVGAPVEAAAMLDLVDNLVQRSILVQTDTPGGPRYRMLESIREYGLRRLDELGAAPPADQVTARHRHREYFAGRAIAAEREWFGAHQGAWSHRLRLELPDLRAALESFDDDGDITSAVAMVSALWPLWIACGLLHEGRMWCRRFVDSTDGHRQAKAQWVCGWIDLLEGDVATAGKRLDHAVELAEAGGDDEALAWATGLRGAIAGFTGDLATAIVAYEKAVALNEGTTDLPGRAVLLQQLAEMYCVADRLDDALRAAQRCRDLSEPLNEGWCSSYATWVQALALHRRREFAAAEELARSALVAKRRLHDRLGIMLLAELLAWNAARTGELERAALLLGAVAGTWNSVGCALMGFQGLVRLHTDAVETVRRELEPATLDSAWRRGANLREEEMIRAALGATAQGDEAPARHPAPAVADDAAASGVDSLLTRRELEVAALVAEGLTNRQIARRLMIGQRTVETHVANLLGKAGLRRRAQVARWLASSESVAGTARIGPGAQQLI